MNNGTGRKSRQNSGFTLVEVSISAVLLSVVSLLGFTASSGAMKSADLNLRMTQLQEDVRSTMRALADHVQPAVKRARPGVLLPSNAQELKIVDTANPNAVTFVVPQDMTGSAFSGLMTIRHETEDTAAPTIDGGQYGNGQLDAGEDTSGKGTNNDGVLNRRLVLIRDDGTRVILGGSNDVANVAFALSPDGSMLQATIVATTRLETGKTRMLRYTLTSNIFLMN
jgi:prepilin-type N-terminal cleavage/methylation domain-containing protein